MKAVGCTFIHRVYGVPGLLPSRPNWVPPPTHPQASVAPPPLGSKRGDTLACGGGDGEPNSHEGTDILHLYVLYTTTHLRIYFNTYQNKINLILLQVVWGLGKGLLSEYFKMLCIKLLIVSKHVEILKSQNPYVLEDQRVYTRIVRHVTGNDKDYLRLIPRVVW